MVKGKLRSPAEVIVFSFITCGIYSLYWIYKFSEEIKNYLDDPSINPGVELLLSIFCPPYIIYWFYKYGKLTAQAHERAGLEPEDNSVLLLILSLLGVGIVNFAIMQSSINKVWNQG